MKKILLVFLLIVITTGCSLNLKGTEEVKTYRHISYSELREMFDNGDSFIFYIGSSTCSHCANYSVSLDKIIENNGEVDIRYLDINSLEEEDQLWLDSNFRYSGTPTTVFIKNGKEESKYNRIVGSSDYVTIVEKFRSEGFIKEG